MGWMTVGILDFILKGVKWGGHKVLLTFPELPLAPVCTDGRGELAWKQR